MTNFPPVLVGVIMFAIALVGAVWVPDWIGFWRE